MSKEWITIFVACLVVATWQVTHEQTSSTEVYLCLNGEEYRDNNSDIDITRIGNSDLNFNYTPLICITNKHPCCKANKTGEWYFPNGSVVPIRGKEPNRSTDFYRNRGDEGMVNLNRVSEDILAPTGTFCCVVPVDSGENATLCANIVHTNSTLGSDDTHYNIAEGDNVTKTTAEEADMEDRTSYVAIASSVSTILVAGALIVLSLMIIIVVFLQRRRKKRFPAIDQYPPKSILYKKRQDSTSVQKHQPYVKSSRECDNITTESPHGQEEGNPANVYAQVVKPNEGGVAVGHRTDNREQYDVVNVECSTEGASLNLNENHIPGSIPSTTTDSYVDVSPYY